MSTHKLTGPSAGAQNCGFLRSTEGVERVGRGTGRGLGPGMIRTKRCLMCCERSLGEPECLGGASGVEE